MGLGQFNPFRRESVWQQGLRTVSDAFGNILREVGNVISKVGNTFASTFQNVLKDPLPTIATLALTAVGVPPYITALVRTAAQGGSIEDMVINMAVAYVGSEIGAAAGDAAFPELGNVSGYGGAGDVAFQTTATDAILKSVISNASAQGATAILQGKDLDQVFNTALTGAVGGLINTSLRTEFGLDPSKFGDRLISDATKAAVSSIFTGKDPGEAIGLALSKSAFGGLANAAASGLKSTFKDLQESSKEFETTKTEADGLRAEIGTESTRLSGLAGELNSTSTALNSRQATLVEAQSLLNLASNAYNAYFVSGDQAALEAFTQRMGYVFMTDPETGERHFVKASKYGPNHYYDAEGHLHFLHYILTPDGNIDYHAQVPTLYEYITIGTEAQNIANQQADYLNNNIPQFKTDVDKFNTNLVTFNTDKSALDTKVTTYTGLVNDLFGEDGNGGLNKKIEDLLVARDGYLEDLDESVTSLTEAAGEQLSGVAKEIADNAVDLLDKNDRSSDEVATAFAGLGYTPSAAEIAQFVGEGDDTTLSNLLGVHVDQNTVDKEEALAAFQGTGYTPTDEELNSFIGQRSESSLNVDAAAFADPRTVDMEEARAAFQGTGYTPTDEELQRFIGQRAESGLEQDAAAFADPRVFDTNEVLALARGEGIELRARDILNLQKRGLIGVGDEVTLRNQLGIEFDNQFVTKNEARQYFQDLGYEVSEDDLDQFVGKRDESAAFTDIQEYVTGQRELDAQEKGFPDYATEQKYSGDATAYKEELAARKLERNNQAAVEAGFPDYATQVKYAGDKDAYFAGLKQIQEAKQLETAKDYFFDDYATFKKYDGDIAAYRADQALDKEKLASDLGFPSVDIYDLYSGDVARYQQDEADYAGFPDWKTYTEYAGDSKAYQNALAVADGWPDADTRDEFKTKERYAQHLRALADEDERGSLMEARQAEATRLFNEDNAVRAGFPDYATQQKFEGNYDAYQKSLLPPVVEPPIVKSPVGAVESGTGTVTTEGGAGNDTLIAGAGTDTLDGGAGTDAKVTGETKADNIVITGEDGATVTLNPDGSLVDVTNAEGNQPSNVQEVVAAVISNPVNIDTLEGATGNNTFVGGEGDDTFVGGEGNDTFVIGGDDTLIGGEGNDTFVGDGKDTLDGGIATTEGGEGNDTLFGAVGNDTVIADGDDSLDGDADEDTLKKLLGDDTFIGGDGNDTVTYDDKDVEPEPTFTCPEGFTYDYELDVCMPDIPVEEEPKEPDIIPTCKEGFTYDYELGVCVQDIAEPPEVIECEEGYVYDPISQTCVPEFVEPPEPVECEEGYVYDPITQTCVPEIITPPEPVECEEGYVYDPIQGICVPEVITPPEDRPVECEEGYVYDPVQGMCVPEVITPPEPVECEEGYVYDPVQGICVPEVISPPEVIECEEGYVYDPVQKMCVPDVPEVIECEEGYVYDPVQGICVPETIVTPPVVTPPVVTPPKPQPPQPPPTPKCPPGYVYDAKLKQCVPISRDLPLGLTPDQFSALFGAQQTAMGPKFEAFYANIPGYKPFDLRQFSSDFYDEE